MTSRRAACAIDADELSIKFALAHLSKSHVHCYEFSAADVLGQVGEVCTMTAHGLIYVHVQWRQWVCDIIGLARR